MVDLSENFCDREREFLLAIKEQCKVSCVKKKIKMIYQEVSIYLKY